MALSRSLPTEQKEDDLDRDSEEERDEGAHYLQSPALRCILYIPHPLKLSFACFCSKVCLPKIVVICLLCVVVCFKWK